MADYQRLPEDHPVQIAANMLAYALAAARLGLAQGLHVEHVKLKLKALDNASLRLATAIAAAQAEDPDFAERFAIAVDDQVTESLTDTFNQGDGPHIPDTPEGLT